VSDSLKNIGQQLTALETVPTSARSRYERQLREILEERLNVPARLGCLAVGVICLLFSARIVTAVFLDPQAYAYWPNLMLGFVVTATALAIGAALAVVAARGIYRRNYEGRWAASSGLVLLAGWGLFMLLAAPGLPDSLRDVFLTLGLVCLGAAAFIAQRLAAARARLMLEKRLLEFEYRLAEISESLDC